MSHPFCSVKEEDISFPADRNENLEEGWSDSDVSSATNSSSITTSWQNDEYSSDSISLDNYYYSEVILCPESSIPANITETVDLGSSNNSQVVSCPQSCSCSSNSYTANLPSTSEDTYSVTSSLSRSQTVNLDEFLESPISNRKRSNISSSNINDYYSISSLNGDELGVNASQSVSSVQQSGVSLRLIPPCNRRRSIATAKEFSFKPQSELYLKDESGIKHFMSAKELMKCSNFLYNNNSNNSSNGNGGSLPYDINKNVSTSSTSWQQRFMESREWRPRLPTISFLPTHALSGAEIDEQSQRSGSESENYDVIVQTAVCSSVQLSSVLCCIASVAKTNIAIVSKVLVTIALASIISGGVGLAIGKNISNCPMEMYDDPFEPDSFLSSPVTAKQETATSPNAPAQADTSTVTLAAIISTSTTTTAETATTEATKDSTTASTRAAVSTATIAAKTSALAPTAEGALANETTGGLTTVSIVPATLTTTTAAKTSTHTPTEAKTSATGTAEDSTTVPTAKVSSTATIAGKTSTFAPTETGTSTIKTTENSTTVTTAAAESSATATVQGSTISQSSVMPPKDINTTDTLATTADSTITTTSKNNSSEYSTTTTTSDSNQCPDGWQQSILDNEKCYLLVGDHKNWVEAEKYCSGAYHGTNPRRTHLTSVCDTYENYYLKALIADSSANNICDIYWIGLHASFNSTSKMDRNNRFTWTDGRPYEYSNWEQDLTNPWTQTEDLCVYMTAGGKWFLDVCSTAAVEHCFICEYYLSDD